MKGNYQITIIVLKATGRAMTVLTKLAEVTTIDKDIVKKVVGKTSIMADIFISS